VNERKRKTRPSSWGGKTLENFGSLGKKKKKRRGPPSASDAWDDCTKMRGEKTNRSEEKKRPLLKRDSLLPLRKVRGRGSRMQRVDWEA